MTQPEMDPMNSLTALGTSLDDGGMSGAMAELGENLQPVREAVEGYRATLDSEGWGDALSRKMAADYHAYILRLLTSALPR